MTVTVDATAAPDAGQAAGAAAAAANGGGARLSAILADVDPALLWRAGDGGPDPAVRDVVLWDPMDATGESRGGILLLIGAAPAERQAAQAVHVAAGLGYAAVVLKRRGADPADLADLAALAGRAGVALLVAADAVPWGSVASALAAAVSAHGCDGGPVIAEAADLFAVANTAATLAEAAVTIEDSGRRVLAYSSVPGQPIDDSRQNTILGRRVPYQPYYNSEYEQVARSPGAVLFPADDRALARVVMPLRVGGRLIGSIWAIDASGERGAAIAERLAEVAPSVALHLLRAAERGDLERQRRADELAAELSDDGGRAGGSLAAKNRLPAALLAFGPLRPPGAPGGPGGPGAPGGLNSPNGPGAVVDTRRLTALLALSVESVVPNASCAQVGDAVFVLLPEGEHATGQQGTGQRSDARVEQLASSALRAVAAELSLTLGAAYATRISSRAALREARADIETALRAVGSAGRETARRIVNLARDRHLVVLQALAESGLSAPDHLLPQVAAMLAWDREHKTEYARTLLVHLDCFGDVRLAAQRLVVHVNSHRYRMRRLVQQFGIDLDDPEFRLVLWLQLRTAASLR